MREIHHCQEVNISIQIGLLFYVLEVICSAFWTSILRWLLAKDDFWEKKIIIRNVEYCLGDYLNGKLETRTLNGKNRYSCNKSIERERERKKSQIPIRVFWITTETIKCLKSFFFVKGHSIKTCWFMELSEWKAAFGLDFFFVNPCLALFLKLQKIVAIQCFICRFVQFHENEESSFYTFFFFLSFSKHMLSYNISSFGTNSCTISSAYSFGITMKHTMHIIIKQWGSTVIQDNRQRRQNLAEKPKNTQ